MFYVGCHRPTTTLLLYPSFGQAVNGALTELSEQLYFPISLFPPTFLQPNTLESKRYLETK